MIYLIINIIMDHLKKTLHNQFTITTVIQGGTLWKMSFEALRKILGKYLKKKSFFSKIAGLEQEFIHA